MTQPNLAPPKFTSYHEQGQSPLFHLPPEIRYEIFAYAVASGPDNTQPLDQNGYSTRPGYETRHRTWTELLRTCKRVYTEAWFMPLICSEHTFFMAGRDRRPGQVMSVERMQECLDLIHDRHGEVEGGHIRLFAQLCELEGSRRFRGIFSMRHFHPRSVTVTIRYTDTWAWEGNSALEIAGEWGQRLVLPSSVQRFNLDIESLERRKDEVDYIVGQAAEKWHFKRRDGVKMLASKNASISVSRWTGSSTLGRMRWVRDEVRPNQLDYYVGTVTWLPSEESLGDRPESNPSLSVKWDRPAPPRSEWRFLTLGQLRSARVHPDASADEAIDAVHQRSEYTDESESGELSGEFDTETDDSWSEDEIEDDSDDWSEHNDSDDGD